MTKENKKSTESDVGDFFKTLFWSFAVFFVTATFIVRPVQVQGSSMFPTLQPGSVGFSNTIGYRISGAERFDIVILRLDEPKEYLVKRLIGLPGETVEYKEGKLYINGTVTEEPFLAEGIVTNDIPAFTLKDNEYFCLGDNRPVSKDSRYYGPFKQSQVSGKGILILYPFQYFGVVNW
ncbi:MAG: signal peptidase I [Solobacterium sp.]|nr:signal peptidase I [Solobacterium sp.]MBR2668576.1 signal peptidase I [Solobacterium sp.]